VSLWRRRNWETFESEVDVPGPSEPFGVVVVDPPELLVAEEGAQVGGIRLEAEVLGPRYHRCVAGAFLFRGLGKDGPDQFG
jgi:hypothetical protein